MYPRYPDRPDLSRLQSTVDALSAEQDQLFADKGWLGRAGVQLAALVGRGALPYYRHEIARHKRTIEAATAGKKQFEANQQPPRHLGKPLPRR